MLTILAVIVWGVVIWDFLLVTLGGAWWLTVSDRIGRIAFGGLRRLSRLGGGALMADLSGAVVMSVVAGFWIIGFWLAWSLLYAGAEMPISSTRTGVQPEFADDVAHVGHLLTTLGGATTQPASQGWNLMGVLVGLNGMLALTMAVSFLLGVRETVQMGRSLSLLTSSGRPDPVALEERVAGLVAGLHGAPFALWYDHRDGRLRVPRALASYAHLAAERGGEVQARSEEILTHLPHFDPDGDGPFVDRMDRWAAHHELLFEGDEAEAVVDRPPA